MEKVLDTTTLAGTTSSRAGKTYLLVIEDGSSRIVDLPTGVLSIGRAPEVGLRLDHASVSRKHATIYVTDGEVRLVDHESHNGTRVNNVAIRGGHVLATGDVVAIGEVILVVHAELARPVSTVILEEGAWRRRLAEEVERAVQFQRELAVIAIAGGELASSSPLRVIDVLGRDGGGMMALLPEADPQAARELAQVALDAMAHAPAARVGIACCPSDVTDVDSLVLAARAAAAVARPGRIAEVADVARRISLDERSVVVCHPAMTRLYELLQRIAGSVMPVLILGESGVGKENAAYAVHRYSGRKGPFVAVNCATLEGLAESELFGHVKGAFTGATAAKVGYFEAARDGTLFLDEVGELSAAVQAKLLRALEHKRVTPVGETVEREIDVRIVAATNRDLGAEVAAGRFRHDLLFRLDVARVHLPPLRERRCEIPILFRELLAIEARRASREPPVPTPAALRALLAHDWPGNVRELRNVAAFVVATVEDDRIEPDDFPPEVARPVAPPPTREPPPTSGMRRLADELEEIERRRMTEAMERTAGVKTRAAALLGMPIRTFNAKFRQYGM